MNHERWNKRYISSLVVSILGDHVGAMLWFIFTYVLEIPKDGVPNGDLVQHRPHRWICLG